MKKLKEKWKRKMVDTNGTIEKIQDILDNEKSEFYMLSNSFFNLLFWKNHSEGYVKSEDKSSIISKIKKNTKKDMSWDNDKNFRLDEEKILPFVNKIRKQIGLPELTNKLDNILREMTDEVRKRLILKGLE